MEGQELGGSKKLYSFYNVFSDVIFYPCVLQKFWISKTILVPCCFDDLAQLLPCLDL